jgi:hypothetical protein
VTTMPGTRTAFYDPARADPAVVARDEATKDVTRRCSLRGSRSAVPARKHSSCPTPDTPSACSPTPDTPGRPSAGGSTSASPAVPQSPPPARPAALSQRLTRVVAFARGEPRSRTGG